MDSLSVPLMKFFPDSSARPERYPRNQLWVMSTGTLFISFVLFARRFSSIHLLHDREPLISTADAKRFNENRQPARNTMVRLISTFPSSGSTQPPVQCRRCSHS